MRKCAITLLTTLLDYNAFGPNLGSEPFEQQTREGATKFKAKLLAKKEEHEAVAKAKREKILAMAEGGDQEDAQAVEETQEQLSDKTMLANAYAEDEELQKDRAALDFFYEAVQFIRCIDSSIPVICQLLSSTTSSDVLECIK